MLALSYPRYENLAKRTSRVDLDLALMPKSDATSTHDSGLLHPELVFLILGSPALGPAADWVWADIFGDDACM